MPSGGGRHLSNKSDSNLNSGNHQGFTNIHGPNSNGRQG
jgi:hypothetical protein